MTVEVGYELEDDEVVTDEHLESLRWGAEELTTDPGSIQTHQDQGGPRPRVSVRFSMRQTAQYKVVGDIHHRFKLSFASYHELPCSQAKAEMLEYLVK
jgi:hypothetical protein